MQDGVVVTQGAGESRIPGRRFLLTRETRERPANGGGKGCRGDAAAMHTNRASQHRYFKNMRCADIRLKRAVAGRVEAVML